jgi:uncharacterized integral membrane protein (TIGR00698 family)
MQIALVKTLSPRLTTRGTELLPGVLVVALMAAVATFVGQFMPAVGAVLPALVIGLVAASIRRPSIRFQPGITYASSFLLQCAVVLLGVRLSLGAVYDVGLKSLPVLLGTLTACLIAAPIVGRLLRVDRVVRTLIGVGTGVCGLSAIAAIAPILGAAGIELATAVSTIFLFNVAAVVLFPLVGHALNMDPATFGLFAGTAVNDTSSVVAAASVFSTAALSTAVVVKLVRTLAIIPISIGLSLLEARRENKMNPRPMTMGRVVKMVPWFIAGFVLMVILNSVAHFPVPLHDSIAWLSGFLIAMALAGIGLSTDLQAMRRAGWRPIALGAILWVIVSATALIIMRATGAI